jgi:small-conductance mechanosensitive channel
MTASLTGKDFLDNFAAGLNNLLQAEMQKLFGPAVNQIVLGRLTWGDLASTACLLVFVLLVNLGAAGFLRHQARRAADHEAKVMRHHVFGALGKPLYLLIWIYGVYFALTPLLLRLPADEGLHLVHEVFDKVFDLGVFAVVFWLFYRFTGVIELHVAALAAKTNSKLDDLFVPLVGKSLRVIVPVIGIIFALPMLNLPAEYAGILSKGSSILLIVAIALVAIKAVGTSEQFVLTQFDIKAADNLQARKVYTQVHVISKVVYVIIGLFTIASILMLFEEVRRFGTSILASAGVVGIIIGFAAQKTISNLFAGFQIAMTQPIRLDDVVIVEGEWGRVEEISLTYVTIRIWDDRRLVVPLGYFIDKPFQNWTRTSAELLGSVFLWVDYTLPLDAIRQALKEIIEPHPLWDKRFWNLQVTDATEKTMQIRVLATTADSGKGWDLRCDIREKLIAYIQKNHPHCLPRFRAEIDGGPGTARLPRADH